MTTWAESMVGVTLNSDQITDISTTSFASEVSAMPVAHWISQASVYQVAWEQYKAEVLDVRDKESPAVNGAYPLVFPLKINMYRRFARVRASLLWGGGASDDKFLTLEVGPRVPWIAEKSEDFKQKLATYMWSVWEESGGGGMLRESSRLYETFGGHYFKILPDAFKLTGVRIESLPANTVYPIWYPNDYRRLQAVIVAYQVDKKTAAQYGVDAQQEFVSYYEMWSEERWQVLVDGKQAKDPVTGLPLQGKNENVDPRFPGQRPRLPFVYIPRYRTGEFYGSSLFADLEKLVQEYNARMADTGDAISESSHRRVWVRNLEHRLQNLLELARGEVVDLGRQLDKDARPDIGSLDPPPIPPTSLEWIKSVRDEAREDAMLSAVILGDSEGSQRSSLSLAMRALLTTTSIDDMRSDWRNAFIQIHELVAIALHNQGKNEQSRATDRMPALSSLYYFITPNFRPVLPRERTSIVEEQVALRGAKLRTLRTAIQRLGDVADVDTEVNELVAELRAEERQEIRVKQAGSSPFGQSGGSSSSSNGKTQVANTVAKTTVQRSSTSD